MPNLPIGASLKIGYQAIQDIRQIWRERSQKVDIRDLQLIYPMVIQHPTWDKPMIQWDLSFKITSRTTDPPGEIYYGIVIEHEEDSGIMDRVTHGMQVSIGDKPLLTEPKFAPLLIRTDFEEVIEFLEDPVGGTSRLRGFTSLENDIDLRIKISSETLTGHVEEITIQRLMGKWIRDNRGIDIQEFHHGDIPEDASLSEGVIGEDITL